MFTKPSQVIIGKKVNIADINSLAVGDITVVDEAMKAASTPAEASALYIGVCTGKQEITLPNGTVSEVSIMKWSDRIQKASKPSYATANFEAPVNAKIEINIADAELVVGHRYVLRILYKDMNIANFQFTHTYEHVATTESADELGNELLKKINKHANRRVNATFEGGKLILVAKDKNYDDAVDSLDEYSIVSMDASLYVTEPGALLSNHPEKVAGAVITKTEGKPGKGFWKQVRDTELRAMGYKGQVYTGAYPSIEQDRMVTKGAQYNYVTIENDNLYLSPDNQYIKTTPVMTEVYCEGAVAAITGALDAFMGIEAGA
ncbi:MAG: hypothetical protein IKY26_01895 [Erysipelotrichaceae bacterium]|nr:hypothetical protein [Erysipelotrichaceae bacterium]